MKMLVKKIPKEESEFIKANLENLSLVYSHFGINFSSKITRFYFNLGKDGIQEFWKKNDLGLEQSNSTMWI